MILFCSLYHYNSCCILSHSAQKRTTEHTYELYLHNSNIYQYVLDTYVTTISATDKDGKAPNNVVFYLIDSGGSDKFRVESTTGRITVQKGANVDREVEPSYNLTVMAMDRGSPALSTTATVSVTVQDVNDEPPHFTTTRQSTQIPENSNDSTLLVTFEATDKDLDSSLLYSILWNISSALNDKDKVVDIQKVKVYVQLISSLFC